MTPAKEFLSCPHCGSDDIREGDPDRDAGLIIIESTCEDCGGEFKEEFEIARTYLVNDEGDTVQVGGEPDERGPEI